VKSWPYPKLFAHRGGGSLAPENTLAAVKLGQSLGYRAHEFDVLHCHLDYWTYSLFGRQSTPFVTTLHGRLDLPELRPIYENFPDVHLVSISDAQRLPLPEANFIATVQHGLPEDLLTPRPVTPRYLAFLGRICPEKRPDRAIRIARKAGIPLKIAAKVDRVDVAYFRDVIEPMIDGSSVELIGEISDAEKPDFLSGAIALLLPIDWPEPFGLVMIEAMACGTPVIAFNRGSVPEIIEHGITGMIVQDEAEAVAAVGQVMRLPRDRVRQRFEERFTAEHMAQNYVSLYRRLVARARPSLRVVS